MKRRITRRDLFKAAPLAGATAAALALGFGRRTGLQVTTKGTCRFCLLHCGIEATTENGVLTRVQGDFDSRTRGFLCQHGRALTEVVHSPQRVRTPLLQQRPVSWNEALGFIADRLERLKREHGPEALMVQSGWPLVRHPLQQLLHRFCRAYGTPNLASVASLCESSTRMAQALTTGSKYPHSAGGAKLMVVWGANPERTTPELAHHLFRRAEEGKLVVVDPVRTTLAKRASEHLHVRPGSDGALALGLANVILEERLYDQTFVAENVSGLDAFAALAARFPPDRVAALTGISREQLVRVARRFGREGPVRIWGGLGVEQHECGVQTVRALVSLEALTGALDAQWAKTQLTPPGERFGDQPLPALFRMQTPEPVPPEPKAKPLGYDEFPLFEVFNREAQGNLFARAVLESKPYAVRGLFCIGSNPLLTAPGSGELRAALDALDLLVVADPFLSATAAIADVVLPAATFAEDEGGVVALQHLAWPDWKIVFELARAMGLGAYFPWTSLSACLAAPAVPFMRDDAHQPRPRVATAARYGTPTGKIELNSTLLEQFGFDGLPEWSAPAEEPGYPLVLVAGPRERVFINSQFRQAGSVRAKAKEPTVQLHPSLGFADGARVRVVTPRGAVAFRARVTDEVHPDAVVAPFGWEEANINLLADAVKLDPISGFPAVRSMRCRVEGG